MKRNLRIWMMMVLLLVSNAGSAQATLAPAEHRRGEEQTYLTFPEWFLVFSPAEYAQFTSTQYPSGFPFWGHVRQFWKSYAAVSRAAFNDKYPLNAGYHAMILVIGVSTTVEYAIRSAYETIIGRLAELTTGQPTDEDVYAAKVAQEYVDFIRVHPWYEFDFSSKLKGLWSAVPWHGHGAIRKWERRYALTTEYLVKAGYGWLIEKGTHASYDTPLLVTAVAVEQNERVELQLLPRYEAFTPAVKKLARDGASFTEIAGNAKGADILLSVLASGDWTPPSQCRVLFEQSILTRPGERRVACVASVGSLAQTLRDIDRPELAIEHIFDY